MIHAEHLRPWLIRSDQTAAEKAKDEQVPIGLSLEEMERKMIVSTLDHFGGHRAKTAQALGIGVRTLSGKTEGRTDTHHAPRNWPQLNTRENKHSA